MKGKGRSKVFSRLFCTIMSVLCLCYAFPLDAFASSNGEELEYQQIDAFVNDDGSEKVVLDGYMPVNASVTAEPADSEETALCSYDITITSGKKEYQPEKNHPIRVEISDTLIESASAADHTLRLWHVLDSGKREEIKNFTLSGDTISFDAYGFSVYVVTDDDPPLCTYSFYYPNSTGGYDKYYFPLDTGSQAYQQILKNGEKLTVPQLPSVSGENSTFMGWFVGNDNGPTADTSFDFSKPVSISSSGEVKLYAVFADFAYAIFHEQYKPDETDPTKGTWPVLATRRGTMKNGFASIKTDDLTVTYDSGSDSSSQHSAPHMIFRGWSKTPIQNAGDTTASFTFVEDTISIKERTDLYPIFSGIRWLTFNTGEGGNYIPPQYYYLNRGTGDAAVTTLSVPTRKGYTFDGWYTAETGGTRVTDGSGKVITNLNTTDLQYKDGSLSVLNDTDLYAHWTPATTTYSVVIWKQSLNDRYDATEKTYDFVKSVQINAKTGNTVTVPSEYTSYKHQTSTEAKNDFTGFYWNETKSNKSATVAGDGSTVLNIYYDRDKFVYTWDSKYTGDSTPTLTGLYAQSLTMYGYVWPSGGTNHGIYKYTDNSTYITLLPYFNDVPNATYDDKNHTYTIHFQSAGTSTNAIIYHHLQKLDGTYSNEAQYCVTANAIKSGNGTTRSFNFSHKFAPAFNLVGYNPNASFTGNWSVAAVPNDTYVITGDFHVYHERNSYDINFIDSLDNTPLGKETYLFEEPLTDAGSTIDADSLQAPEGMEFSGWYYDRDCTTPVDFTDMIMPSQTFSVYAGWEKVTYLVELDPNGGTLLPSQRTWYEVEHGGDPIVEYSTTRRDYVASQEGNYYYYYGGYPTEHDETKGDAYYTTDIGNGADLSVSYKYEPNNYRYAQWYEVKEDGTEEIYKFGEPVMHDTKLVLHWKDLTTYYVRYEAGEGKLDGNDTNEDVFEDLDTSDYVDKAKIVVTRTAEPPMNKNFIGWRIRGDNSGNVYYPGQDFEFTSAFARTEVDKDGKTKKVITLDAVYQEVNTAKIIYDANGGTVASGADLGAPTDTDPIITPNRKYTAATGTISNLVNNSGVQLSSGEGFSNGVYEFTGWNTELDGSGQHFDKSAIVNVDSDEPVTLYAEWRIKVYFDKNNENVEWGDEWNTDTKYAYDSNTGRYYITTYLHAVIDEPPYELISSKSDESFLFWGDARYTEELEEFDFSQPVEAEMILYADYGTPLNVPIHVADSSQKIIENKDNEWRIQSGISVRAGVDVPLTKKTDTTDYVDAAKVNGYEYAFACLSDSFKNVSDSKTIASVTYNRSEKRVWVKYTDGTSGPMPTDKEIYLVFYKHPKTLPIGYDEIKSSGGLTALATINSAPKTADIANSGNTNIYDMGTSVSDVASYLQNGTEYKYFSYALGSKEATSTEDLRIITSPVAVTSTSKPHLYVKDAWNGITYSTDGSTWHQAGDDVQLYVVYYKSQPTIVNLEEETIGLPSDMSEEFEYSVVIEEVTETTVVQMVKSSNKWKTNKELSSKTDTKTISPENYKVILSNGEAESFTLFHNEITSNGIEYTSKGKTYRDDTIVKTYQTIKIVQTAKEGYTTDHDGTNGTHTSNLIYEYSTKTDPADQDVLYTNIHTPVPIELHVAVIEGGKMVLKDDTLRSKNETDYKLDIDIDKSYSLSDTAQSGLFAGDRNDYVFAGIVYGTDENGIVSSSANDITTVKYGQLQTTNTYGSYVNNNKDYLLDEGRALYYVYYRKPRVVYVKETPEGLKVIDEPEMNGSSVTLNGKTAESWDILEIGDGLTFSQSGAGFRVPPKLDGQDELSLVYSRIGVGTEDSPYTLTDSSTDKYMELRINNGSVEYRYSASDKWKPFDSAPVVYVVYKEVGYDLHITKEVIGMSSDQTFTLTIHSDKLKDEKAYMISGYPNITTVNPVNKTITLEIKNGSDFTISGLPEGTYTLTENDITGNTLTANVNGYRETVTNNSFSLYLEKDSEAVLTNTLEDVAVTGVTDNQLPYLVMVLMLLGFWMIRRKYCYRKPPRMITQI